MSRKQLFDSDDEIEVVRQYPLEAKNSLPKFEKEEDEELNKIMEKQKMKSKKTLDAVDKLIILQERRLKEKEEKKKAKKEKINKILYPEPSNIVRNVRETPQPKKEIEVPKSQVNDKPEKEEKIEKIKRGTRTHTPFSPRGETGRNGEVMNKNKELLTLAASKLLQY